MPPASSAEKTSVEAELTQIGNLVNGGIDSLRHFHFNARRHTAAQSVVISQVDRVGSHPSVTWVEEPTAVNASPAIRGPNQVGQIRPNGLSIQVDIRIQSAS